MLRALAGLALVALLVLAGVWVVVYLTAAGMGDRLEGAEVYVANSSGQPLVLLVSAGRSGQAPTTVSFDVPADGVEHVSPLVVMPPYVDASASIAVFDSGCRLRWSQEVRGFGRYRLTVTPDGASVEPYADAPASAPVLAVSAAGCRP